MAAYSICRSKKKNFQSFTVICRKPHVASSICLRPTIFRNPDWPCGHPVCLSGDNRIWMG
jgi:hypothetical protein